MTPPLWFRLEDASQLSLVNSNGTTTPVDSPTLFLAWQAWTLQQRRIARTWPSDVTLSARVNHGRWVTDCHACYQGMFTHPAWRIACCGECGATYRGVEFPPNIEEITGLLLTRPDRTTQNWEPGESTLMLKLENLAHGLGWSG